MKSKAIARIIPINDDGDGRLPFYARTVIGIIGGFEGVDINGSVYSCKEKWWKVEMLPTQWNGEGLPPVGTECEYCDYKDNHHKVFIIARYNNETFIEWRSDTYSGTDIVRGSVEPGKFRPIRSERDKAIDALSLVILESHADDDEDMNTETYIYDAISAGKIPGIKLED